MLTNGIYLANCVAINNNGTYKMDHLHRVNESLNLKWKNPGNPDIVDMMPEHIFDCNIIGEWNVSNERMITCTLKNHEQIHNLVKDL